LHYGISITESRKISLFYKEFPDQRGEGGWRASSFGMVVANKNCNDANRITAIAFVRDDKGRY
jgi:hypothetical protein